MISYLAVLGLGIVLGFAVAPWFYERFDRPKLPRLASPLLQPPVKPRAPSLRTIHPQRNP